MDAQTLLLGMQFTRDRLLGTLLAVEKSEFDSNAVLRWRPGPLRAHIAWQAMHCAATHHDYGRRMLLGLEPVNKPLLTHYAGGSTPSDHDVPELDTMRHVLEEEYQPLQAALAACTPEQLNKLLPGPGGKDRSLAEIIALLTWHEAHHQGQMHLTFNLYKQAHG